MQHNMVAFQGRFTHRFTLNKMQNHRGWQNASNNATGREKSKDKENRKQGDWEVIMTRYVLHAWVRQLPCNYSRTPITRTWITRTTPLARTNFHFPWIWHPLFSHFYSVNSNSDNSKTPLTRTTCRFCFPWTKFGSNLRR